MIKYKQGDLERTVAEAGLPISKNMDLDLESTILAEEAETELIIRAAEANAPPVLRTSQQTMLLRVAQGCIDEGIARELAIEKTVEMVLVGSALRDAGRELLDRNLHDPNARTFLDRLDAESSIPINPPADFDPMDAGESWEGEPDVGY